MTFRSAHSNDLRMLHKRGSITNKQHEAAHGQVHEVSGILKEAQTLIKEKGIEI